MRNFQLVLPIPPTGGEMEVLFPTRRACLSAIIDARWPEGFACRACGHARYWVHRKRPLLECAGCGTQTSPLAGTVFANAKLPLPKLFRLCHELAVNPGASESELAQRAGVSPPTAGTWKRKLQSRLDVRDSEHLRPPTRMSRADGGEGAPQDDNAWRTMRITIGVASDSRRGTAVGARRAR